MICALTDSDIWHLHVHQVLKKLCNFSLCFPLAFVGSLELCTQASHLQMNSFAHVLNHMPFLSFPPLRVLAVTSVLCQVAVLRTGSPLSFLSLGGIQSFSSKCVSCSVFRFSIDVIYQISLHFLFSKRFYIDEVEFYQTIFWHQSIRLCVFFCDMVVYVDFQVLSRPCIPGWNSIGCCV